MVQLNVVLQGLRLRQVRQLTRRSGSVTKPARGIFARANFKKLSRSDFVRTSLSLLSVSTRWATNGPRSLFSNSSRLVSRVISSSALTSRDNQMERSLFAFRGLSFIISSLSFDKSEWSADVSSSRRRRRIEEFLSNTVEKKILREKQKNYQPVSRFLICWPRILKYRDETSRCWWFEKWPKVVSVELAAARIRCPILFTSRRNSFKVIKTLNHFEMDHHTWYRHSSTKNLVSCSFNRQLNNRSSDYYQWPTRTGHDLDAGMSSQGILVMMPCAITVA